MSKVIFRALLGVVALLAFTAATVLPAHAQQKPHHVKAGVTCAACHGAGNMSRYEPVPTATCLKCHGDRAALIKRTERLNKVVQEKNPVTGQIEKVVKDLNPHSGHHDRGRLDCFECHREHKPSKILCAQCHDVERWMRPAP